MKFAGTWAMGAAALLLCAGAATAQDKAAEAEKAPAQERAVIVDHGRFKDVRLHKPKRPATSFVILFGGDKAMKRGMEDLAQQMTEQGALVAEVNTADFFEVLEKAGGDCAYIVGDMENLSRFIQAYARVPTYFPPLLVGYGNGATLAYGILSQAKPAAFGGGVLLGFSPDMTLKEPLCHGEGVASETLKHDKGTRLLPVQHLQRPLVVLGGLADKTVAPVTVQAFFGMVPHSSVVRLPKVGHDFARPAAWMPQFEAAFADVASQAVSTLPAVPKTIADLPVIEVPAPGNSSDTYAILLSGDGGWASIDKDVAGALADSGIPVVGFDSLRYFWEERSAENAAADIDRLIHFYGAQWRKKRVMLIGYSQGADVLPFIYNRLSRSGRSQITLLVPIALSPHAAFEFHLSNWVGGSGDVPTMPEMQKIADNKALLCIYGKDSKPDESLCEDLDPKHYRAVGLPGGHHFNGDYKALAQIILGAKGK